MIDWLIYWLKDIDVLVTNNKSNIRKKANTFTIHQYLIYYRNYK